MDENSTNRITSITSLKRAVEEIKETLAKINNGYEDIEDLNDDLKEELAREIEDLEIDVNNIQETLNTIF